MDGDHRREASGLVPEPSIDHRCRKDLCQVRHERYLLLNGPLYPEQRQMPQPPEKTEKKHCCGGMDALL